MRWPLVGLLSRYANIPAIGGLVAVGVLLYLVFRWRAAYLSELSGIAQPILDGRLWYSPDTVAEVAKGLGPQGRTLYAISELTLDVLFPLVYGTAFALLILSVMQRASP